MNDADLKDLETAVALLENPSWVAQVTNLIGMPIEWAVQKLPRKAHALISETVYKAIRVALKIAVLTLNPARRRPPGQWRHRLAVSWTGAGGGLFGSLGLAVELPISTAIMLRSIADIARSQGEDLRSGDAQLACVQVFALGGRRPVDDAAESGYWAVRIALARAVTEAAEYITQKGLVEEGAPVLVRLISRIAARFEVVVTEKAAAQIVPIVGAAGGAAINLLFISHFQAVARGHFIIRRLERSYGEAEVKQQYLRLLPKN